MTKTITASRLFYLLSLIISASPAQSNTQQSMALCTQSISLGARFIEDKENVERQRMEAGSISAETYNTAVQQLDGYSAQMSVQTCMNSQGVDRDYYLCIVEQSGNINNCTN